MKPSGDLRDTKYMDKSLTYPNRNSEHWSMGVSRRDFMKSALAVSLLASIAGCKPGSPRIIITGEQDLINQSSDIVELGDLIFTEKQHRDLLQVYMHMFPDDGDGPSAADLNILTYLEWALTDDKNIADGDPEFIIQGLNWLHQFAEEKYSKEFSELTAKQQENLLQDTSKSEQGRRWMSILSYYLIEALTLDPYYGGNTKQAGWIWLQHQGGFPHPVKGKTYRNFTS